MEGPPHHALDVGRGQGKGSARAQGGAGFLYRSEDSLISVAVATRPSFSVGPRRGLFAAPYFGQPDHAEYDVSRDNQHFVFIGSASAKPGLTVSLNWFEELRRRAAGPR